MFWDYPLFANNKVLAHEGEGHLLSIATSEGVNRVKATDWDS